MSTPPAAQAQAPTPSAVSEPCATREAQERAGRFQRLLATTLPATTRRLRGWLDWLYPVRCLHCDCALLGWHSPGLCTACEKEISWLDHSACRRCGSFLDTGAHANGQQRQPASKTSAPNLSPSGADALVYNPFTSADNADAIITVTPSAQVVISREEQEERCAAVCAHCAGREWRYTRVAGVARYKPPGRELVHDFKFQGNHALARYLAEQMIHRLYACDFPHSYDFILPVPLHPKRLRMRGYNQSLLLAQGVARGVAGELRTDLLRRIRYTQAQALTAPGERAKNIAGAFRADPKALADRSVLLIDDVMTTGATVNECALELRNAGAKRIYVLVWAR